MSNRRSLFILFSIIALSFILLTSYIGNNEPGVPFVDPARDPISADGVISILTPSEHTLSVAVALQPQEYERLLEWSRRYEKRHPNVRVESVNLSDLDAYERFMEKAELGELYDIVLLENDWVYAFATDGRLAPLPDGMITDLDNRLAPVFSSQVQWNGLTWAVPMDLDPYVVVYRPDVLERFGLDSDGTLSIEALWQLHQALESGAAQEELLADGPLPNDAAAVELASAGQAAGRNPAGRMQADGAEDVGSEAPPAVREHGEPWMGVSHAASALSSPEGSGDNTDEAASVAYGIAVDALDPYALVALLWASGLLTVSDEAPGGLEPADPESLDALVRIVTDEAARAPFDSDSGGPKPEAWRMLEEGRIAVLIAPLSEYSQYGADGELRVSLLPGGTDDAAPSLWARGRSWAVFSRSPDAEAAFQWIEAITDDQPQLAWASASGRLPASETALQSDAARWPAGLTERWFREAGALPAAPDYVERLADYQDAIRSVWAGETDLEPFKTAIPRIWRPASSPSP